MQSVSCLRSSTLMSHALKASSSAVANSRLTDLSMIPVVVEDGMATPVPPAPLLPVVSTLHQQPLAEIPGFTSGSPAGLFSRQQRLSRNGVLKALAVAVGGASPTSLFVRHAHTDMRVPDFSSYRRRDNANPQVKTDPNPVRAFTYFASGVSLAAGTVLGKEYARRIVSVWSPSKDVLALAKIEVNLGDIPLGKNVVLKWRGKPLFIKHRTPADIEREAAVDVSTLRDPQSDAERVKGDPKWLVLIGVCTHLGCVPIAGQGDFNGYFCPCHGSHYDGSGRIRKGPAPLNLEVPHYEFAGDVLVVG